MRGGGRACRRGSRRAPPRASQRFRCRSARHRPRRRACAGGPGAGRARRDPPLSCSLRPPRAPERAASGSEGRSPRLVSTLRSRAGRRHPSWSRRDGGARGRTQLRLRRRVRCLARRAALRRQVVVRDPSTSARLESGGRSCGRPGPIIVTGTSRSASRAAHAYPETPLPTTTTALMRQVDRVRPPGASGGALTGCGQNRRCVGRGFPARRLRKNP